MDLTLASSPASSLRIRSGTGVLRTIAGFSAAAIIFSAGPAQAQSQDFDINEIILPTDLVASVVRIEDDILISNLLLANGGSEGGNVYAKMGPPATQSGSKSGNIFDEVDAAATEQIEKTPAAVPDASVTASVNMANGATESATAANALPVEAPSEPVATPESLEISVASLAKADVAIPGPDETIEPAAASAEPAQPDSVKEPAADQPALAAVAPVTEQQETAINEDEIILGWATAWSNNDVEGYLSYYADEFVPANGLPRDEWEANRRKRLRNQDIRIIVSNAELFSVEGDKAEVRFTQRYTSKSYKDRVIKSIRMQESSDGWKFLSEKTLEKLPFK